MLLNGLIFRSLITDNSLSSVIISMDMAIFLTIARKNQKHNWKMRRLTNGLKFRKQPPTIRLINQKAKEIMLEKAPILVRKNL